MPFIAIIGFFLLFRILSIILVQSVIFSATALDRISADRDRRIRKAGALCLLALAACLVFSGALVHKTLAQTLYIATPQAIALVLGLLFAVDLAWTLRKAVPLFEKIRQSSARVAPSEFRKFYETAIPLLLAEIGTTLLFLTTL